MAEEVSTKVVLVVTAELVQMVKWKFSKIPSLSKDLVMMSHRKPSHSILVPLVSSRWISAQEIPRFGFTKIK